MKKQFSSRYPALVSVGAEERPVNYCGIRCTLEVLGGKWKLLVMLSLLKGPQRYAELRESTPEISDKMLVSTLRDLEYQTLIQRRTLGAGARQVEYSLTAYGHSVQPLLLVLYDWGERHIAEHADLLFH
ncbi:MAG TPA: helix-turn-helix domain-containing protein [Hymenobacter sp.]|jgi:DNA-binding HxlR family transcriptional regulator